MNEFTFDKTYAPSLKIPKFIQFTFKFLNFISTRVALKFAAKLFTTPISFKRPKREVPMLDASQKKIITIPAISKEIHVLTYGYSDKKVLLAHGWAGRDTQLFMIANKLLEKGFMVIAFDAPSHGKSSGKQTNLLEYIEAVKEINKQFGPFEAAVGHSFGGMTLLNAHANTAIFKCIVTIGSGNSISTILNNFSNNLGLSKSFGQKLKCFLEQKWNVKVDSYSSSVVAKKISVPVFVIHDVLDGDVHVSCGIKIRQNLQKGQLLITQGLGHTKILRDKNITNRIINYIIKNI